MRHVVRLRPHSYSLAITYIPKTVIGLQFVSTGIFRGRTLSLIFVPFSPDLVLPGPRCLFADDRTSCVRTVFF